MLIRVEPVQRFADERGSLEKILPRAVPGEVYLVRARPGAVRGDHYHLKMGEWFVALAGRGVLRALDPRSGDRAEAPLDAATPSRLYVPAGVGHALINTGDDDLVVLALAERGHDPDDVYPCAASTPGPARDGSPS